MTRLAATLPGYANVARVSEVLHLAPRSVRDLIYTGRLPSVRVGRQHYLKATDVDLERRRRLAVPMPGRRTGESALRVKMDRITCHLGPTQPDLRWIRCYVGSGQANARCW